MKESIRTVKDFPIPGIQFRDITGLLEDPKAFKESIIALTSGNSIKALVTAFEKNDINPKFT